MDTDDDEQKRNIANDLRHTVTQGSAVALKHVHLVEEDWIIKTSSGKTARLANRDKFIKETVFSTSFSDM